MSTYKDLRDRALVIAQATGATDLTTIAEYGLEEAMKYIASQVELPDLTKSATYTWQSGDTEASIATDFSVTDYQTPIRLYVGSSTSTGTPYEYLAYLTWLDLAASPAENSRYGVSDPSWLDSRPSRCYTVEFDKDTILIAPCPAEAKVITLVYASAPTEYGDGSGVPPLPATNWEFILVNGAALYVQAVKENPAGIVEPYSLLTHLDPSIAEMKRALLGTRRRPRVKLSNRYRIPGA